MIMDYDIQTGTANYKQIKNIISKTETYQFIADKEFKKEEITIIINNNIILTFHVDEDYAVLFNVLEDLANTKGGIFENFVYEMQEYDMLYKIYN